MKGRGGCGGPCVMRCRALCGIVVACCSGWARHCSLRLLSCSCLLVLNSTATPLSGHLLCPSFSLICVVLVGFFYQVDLQRRFVVCLLRLHFVFDCGVCACIAIYASGIVGVKYNVYFLWLPCLHGLIPQFVSIEICL